MYGLFVLLIFLIIIIIIKKIVIKTYKIETMYINMYIFKYILIYKIRPVGGKEEVLKLYIEFPLYKFIL